MFPLLVCVFNPPVAVSCGDVDALLALLLLLLLLGLLFIGVPVCKPVCVFCVFCCCVCDDGDEGDVCASDGGSVNGCESEELFSGGSCVLFGYGESE